MSTLKTNAIQTVAGKPILNSTGSILQVVQTIKTDTFAGSTNSWIDVTGLNASITPSSTSNRILIMVTLGAVGNGEGSGPGNPGTVSSGAVNTGGGGGGVYSSGSGGSGGSGVVILRYPNVYTISNPGGGLTFTTATVSSDKVTTVTAGTGNVSFAL